MAKDTVDSRQISLNTGHRISVQQMIDYPISWLATEYQNGGRSAKDTLAAFYGVTRIDISAKNTLRALELSLEIFDKADPNEEWGHIRYGRHGQDSINVKDKWEFLEKYITPIFDKLRPIIHQYDVIEQQTFARCDQLHKEISEAKPQGGQYGVIKGHSQKTRDRVEKVAELRAEGKTQEEVGNELKIDQSNVSRLQNMQNEQDIVLFKSHIIPTKPKSNYGNSKAHTIAVLKRDGHADLAQQVESGQLTAAAARREAGYVVRDRKSFSVGSGTKAESLAVSMAERLPLEFINDLYSELGKLIQEKHNEHNWIP